MLNVECALFNCSIFQFSNLSFINNTDTYTAANLNILDVDIAVVAVYFFVCDPEMAIYKSDKFQYKTHKSQFLRSGQNYNLAYFFKEQFTKQIRITVSVYLLNAVQYALPNGDGGYFLNQLPLVINTEHLQLHGLQCMIVATNNSSVLYTYV